MNCQDNSRLKVPLPELCNTTDIGCVPITSGKPDCPPESDQLPLAYDKNSQTLWLFDCDTRKWIAFSKFQLGELDEVSLDNITNICSLLKIPVYYNPGSGTVQGSMPLADFADKLQKCLDLESKVAILPTGNVAFSIEGLDTLDPLYVKYENLTVSGAGTSASPFTIKAQDPITKWPRKTETDVDNASSATLAANLDGQMVQVPYPKKPCAYPKMTKAQVKSASDVLVIGCVDDKNVKIPYPDKPEDAGTATQDQVDAANNKWLLAVINGELYRIPFPKETCEYTALTATQISRSNNAWVAACVDGKQVKVSMEDFISLVESGTGDILCSLPFATNAELVASKRNTIPICVNGTLKQVVADDSIFKGMTFPTIPTICDGPPTGAPTDVPFRIDCNGYFWVWDATSKKWIRFGGSTAPDDDTPSWSSSKGKVNNICTDVLVRGYYKDKSKPNAGLQNTKLTIKELADALDGCGLASETELANYFRGGFNATSMSMNMNGRRMDNRDYAQYDAKYTSAGIFLKDIQLNDNYVATYALHSQRFIAGRGTKTTPSGTYSTEGKHPGGVPLTYTTYTQNNEDGKKTITNPYDRPATAVIQCGVTLYINSLLTPRFWTGTVVCACATTENARAMSDHDFLCGYRENDVRAACASKSASPYWAIVSTTQVENMCLYATDSPARIGGSGLVNYAPLAYKVNLAAKESKDVYMRVYFTWYSPEYLIYGVENPGRTRTISTPGFGQTSYISVTYFPR